MLNGKRYRVERADCLTFMAGLPDGCVDLVFGSPQYEEARLYLENGEDLGIAMNTEEWVAWMVQVVREACRISKGLVAFVVEGQTENYRYSCGPYLLMADLCRAGFNLRRPCIYRRSGIPGSGGPDWFRCDHEPIICVTPPGRLPWSETTACGHPPKWAPGGEMSHRLANGQRVNQWGMNVRTNGTLTATDSPVGGDESPKQRTRKPSHKTHTKAKPNGTDEQQDYAPPVLANPGTVVQKLYTSEEVAALLGEPADVLDCVVGGGQMGEGDGFSRQNEAPFPEQLPERFIRSFCPEGGIVLDPFSGSGTTSAVALRWNRRALACDLRESQVQLTLRRLGEETPLALFAEGTP